MMNETKDIRNAGDSNGDGELGLDPSQNGQVYDAVFGTVGTDGPNYHNVGWGGTIVLMMKTQIGLGVLSIPGAFNTLGLIPGVICLLAIAGITTWSDYMVGVFKQRHPHVYGIDDSCGLMFGSLIRELFAIIFCLDWILIAGSGMLGTSIGLNAVSTHGICTAGFVAIAAAVGFGTSSIRTLGSISWFVWVGLSSILIAIFTVTIAVGVQDRPAAAPREGPWTADYKLFASPRFADAMSAIASIVFAYAGTPGFFPIISEMREPRLYTRSMLICQSAVTLVYVAIGVVVYYFCGSYVASPALGSAGVLLKKVCYGLALPGLLVTVTLFIHMAAKSVFVRILRDSHHLAADTLVHWLTWLGCTFGTTLMAYCIASGIPVFGGLVSLVGASLGTLMAFQPMGCMWLYDNWKTPERNTKWVLMSGWSVFVIVVGTFIMVAGTYGSVVGIIEAFEASGGSAAWSCADNSNSV